MSDARNEATSSHDHLIARLREMADIRDDTYGDNGDLYRESIDTIADLRYENERLKAENLVQLAKLEGQRIALVNLTAFVEAVGGLSPEAVEWAIKGFRLFLARDDTPNSRAYDDLTEHILARPAWRAQILKQGELT